MSALKAPAGLQRLAQALPGPVRKTLQRALRLIRPLVKWGRFAGFRYRCPVCGRSSRRFAPHGDKRRPNAACPWCRAAERHRFLWLVMERHLDRSLSEDVRLLHVAPEHAFQIRLKARTARCYVGLDLKSPLADVHADLSQGTPFKDASFDIIICSHVLEHIPDDRAAMRELHRILAPYGAALVMVPVAKSRYETDEDPAASDEERTRRFGQADHVRRYGRDVIDRLEDAGFEVEEVAPEDVVSTEVIRRARLTQPETGSVFLCGRST